ncbi:MAG: tRNA (adenosine(37)-N6)-threonylcarbamoyltransferase complex ATPase subunit type 1 TsaE [Christensenellaceae bacterium]
MVIYAVIGGKYMQEFFSESEQQTQEFAKKLAYRLEKGSFIAVYGDLGAGKTAFVKGLAQGLGIKDSIVSPTFTILRAYEDAKIPLYHFDVYRIDDEDELFEIGFDEYANGEGVCVCEWANLIPHALPKVRMDITIERISDSKRRILIDEAQ